MELSLRLDTLGLAEVHYLRSRERYRDWPPFVLLAASGQTRIFAYMSRDVAEQLHQQIVVIEEAAGLDREEDEEEENTLDEERRLFYVAITRAMQTLRISHCAARKKYGVKKPCHPSRFLKELPPELVEQADERSKKPVTVETGKSMFDAIRQSLG